MLRRAVAQRKHVPMFGAVHLHGYKRVPDSTYGADVLRAPDAPSVVTLGKDKIRGTGLWGPENRMVMRTVLWNRFKQRTPQRITPSHETQQATHTMDVTVFVFAVSISLTLLFTNQWAERYRAVHDRYPWTAPRNDNLRGAGHLMWFLE